MWIVIDPKNRYIYLYIYIYIFISSFKTLVTYQIVLSLFLFLLPIQEEYISIITIVKIRLWNKKGR